MKLACVTAVCGGYDKIVDPLQPDLDGVDFICYTDKPKLRTKVWKVRPACTDFNGHFDAHCRNAKRHKVMIHEYVDCDYSLWIDGLVSLVRPMKYLMSILPLDDYDIWLFSTPNLNCIYDEIDMCCRHGLDREDVLRKQYAEYEAAGYPRNNGLYAGGIILRKHTEKVKEFNCYWWNEICKHSRRDQISLMYSAWQVGLKIGQFPASFYKNSWCIVKNHALPYNHPRCYLDRVSKK